MKQLKILSVFLCLCLAFSVLCGCEKDTSENYVYFNVQTKPATLDPQTAKTDEELMIIRNIFEGLLRKNEKGETVNGACKSYSKSGLVYTFELREDACWEDETPLTAEDFVFGMRRAVTPNVKAAFANRLENIKNAKEILAGKLNPDSLGVEAAGEHTLKITLSAEDKYFLDALTTSVAMPCNEKFFKSTVGKYGLEADFVLGNGTYRLKKWNPDDFGIRLYRSKTYKGDFKAKNGAVFISSKEDETPGDFFSKGSVDCAFVKTKDINSLEKLKINRQSFQNTVWFLTISPEYDARIRKSFVEAFSGDIYKDKLPDGFQIPTSIYPDVLSGGKPAGEMPEYNLKNAMESFSEVIKNMPDKQFPTSTLVYYENESVLPAIKAILGHWQKNLCAFINISPAKHPDELITQLYNKDVPFALFPVTARSADLDEYLLNFRKNGLDMAAAQKELLSDNTLIPVAYENTNICYSSQLENLYCDFENGYIDFSFAIKRG